MLKAGLLMTGGAAMFTLMLRAPQAWAQDYSSSFDPTYAADAESDQVLELPQVAAPEQDEASSDDSSTDPDQLSSGDLNDYQNQAAGAAAVAQAAPPLMTVPPGVIENANPPYAPIAPPVIIVARPGGLGPFPATSPMLTTPAGSRPVTRVPSVAGGWWQRSHR